MATDFTLNYNLARPDFNISPWHDDINNNFTVIDAVLFTLTGFGNIKGVWTNSTAYTVGERVVDDTDATVWRCEVSHTSAAAPDTFADDRAANPTFWTALGLSFGAAVQWTTATAYSVNDFLIDQNRYGVAVANYTSGASYNADVAAGNVITLIDLSGYQLADAALTSIAGLTTAADRMIYTTASDTYAVTTLTSLARTLLDDTTTAAMRSTLQLGTSSTVNTGTSGALIPLLNGTNTWSGAQTFTPLGINFAANVASGVTDLTEHISLHSSGYGFSITGNSFNMVAPATADVVWYDGAGVERMRLDMATGDLTIDGAFSGATQNFPSGTLMLFQQTAAPTGWTKQATHNNKALRVVTGTASSGGTTAFSSVFASRTPAGTIGSTTATGTVGGTALTTSQLPSHTHGAGTLTGTTDSAGAHTHTFPVNSDIGGGNEAREGDGVNSGTETTSSAGTHSHTVDVNAGATAATGSGATHNHSFTGTAHGHTFTGTAMDFAVQFVDLIIAAKD